MANESKVDYQSGNNLYNTIRKDDGQVYDTTVSPYDSTDSWVDWNTANVANYDVAMVDKSGDRYVGDFPAVITDAGRYSFQTWLRAGANPADGDGEVAVQPIKWSGTEEVFDFEIDGGFGVAAFADVKAQVDAALVDINLDHLLKVAVATGQIEDAIATDSILALVLSDDGDKCGYDNTTDSLEAIRNNQQVSAAAAITAALTTIANTTVTAMLAKTGITAGGTWTYSKIIKVILAILAGKIQLKSGSSSVYEILDPDDGTTVIAELTPSASTPFRSVSVS